MNLATIIRTTTYMAEAVSSPGQWDRAAYLKAINWSCGQAARMLGCTAAIWSGQACPSNDNRIALVPAPIAVLRVRNPMTSRELLRSDETTESGLNPAWRYTTGTPTAWVLEAGNRIRLNRKVASVTNFDVEVLETPTALVADADVVDVRFPDFVQQALRFGAAYYLWNQAGDAQDLARAGAAMAQFNRLLGLPAE